MERTIRVTGKGNVFEEDYCDRECLDVLYRLGISTDRSMAVAKWLHYEKLESDLEQGEIYHNFNGSDYRLMEKYSGRNMLFMDVDSGQFVVGIGVDYFCRYPKGEDKHSDLCETGIEWGHGLYLGNTPSTINFALLRGEYPKPCNGQYLLCSTCISGVVDVFINAGLLTNPPKDVRNAYIDS